VQRRGAGAMISERSIKPGHPLDAGVDGQ
jgi:hypothetical protein